MAQRLSQAQLRALWLRAGGDPARADQMAAVAMAESSGDPSALNPDASTGDYSVGPWQINYYGNLRAGRTARYGTPEQLRADPARDAAAAVDIYNSQGPTAWSTYKSGAYKKFLGGEQTSPVSAALSSGLAEAFYDPLGSYNDGAFGAAIGGHSDHVHVSYTDPKAMLGAISLAKRYGLQVGENPYVGSVAPVHVKGSYHYRTFPGSYGGKQLGQGADVSGSPDAMAKFYRTVTSGGAQPASSQPAAAAAGQPTGDPRELPPAVRAALQILRA